MDFDGSEQFTIRVLDLESGENLGDEIPNTYYGLEWANDNRTFYYSVLDEHHRPVYIYRHTLGADPSADELVYHEEDPRFFAGVGKSNSGRFIYVASGGNNMSEWRFLDADDPASVPVLIEPRATDFEYDVEDHGERFIIRHNGKGARDFMLATAPIDNPGWDNWSDFMPHEPGRPIRGIQAYVDHLVVACRQHGLPQVMVRRLSDGDTHYIAGVDEDDFAMSPLAVAGSLTPVPCVLPTRPSRPRRPCTTTTWPVASGSCANSRKYPPDTTAANTRPAGFGLRPGTARRSLSAC